MTREREDYKFYKSHKLILCKSIEHTISVYNTKQ